MTKKKKSERIDELELEVEDLKRQLAHLRWEVAQQRGIQPGVHPPFSDPQPWIQPWHPSPTIWCGGEGTTQTFRIDATNEAARFDA